MQRKNIKNTQINKNAKSYLAKLLATENISVEHRKVKTAYFDLQKRLLVVPIWKEMNKDILDLLLAHEIGHALYTPMKEWKKAVDEEKIPHSFLNVIEDARIEKLVKRKYPGITQSFIKGYRDLIANDFFKTKDRNVDDMLLIDRLNMHFKSSFVESDIYFTSEEEKIVERMLNLETFEDVKKLAKELAGYCSKEAETKQMNDLDEEFDEDGEPLDLDSEDSDSEQEQEGGSNAEEEEQNEENEKSEEENEDSNGASSDSKDEEEEEPAKEIEPSQPGSSGKQGFQSTGVSSKDTIKAETDSAWTENQINLLDKECKDNDYIHIHEFKNVSEYIIDYKKVLKDFKEKKQLDFSKSNHYKIAYNRLIADWKKYQQSTNKAVNYMVKEFEMKKAAAAHSRSKQDKSGIIDPLKLHSYKYNDDIFKRLTITPDGKNHGLMMFIDWSGSMADKISDTVKQLINLTMFCRKVQIPFEVYAFSNCTQYYDKKDKHGYGYRDTPKPVYQNGDTSIDEHMILLNFVSSKMSAKEYDEGMLNLYFLSVKYGTRNWHYSRRAVPPSYLTGEEDPDAWKKDLHHEPSGYGMYSTPLNDCIMAAMKMVPAFQTKYNIDKMNTIFLTDGSSDGNGRIVLTDPEEIREHYKLTKQDYLISKKEKENNYCFKGTNYMNNHVLVDRVTKKQVVMDNDRDMTEHLLATLRQRTGSKVLGFYICARKRLDRYVLDKYFPQEKSYYSKKGTKVFDRRKIMAKFRKDKVLVASDNTGYDELYIMTGKDLKVSDGSMATPSENAKKGEIKKLFTSTLKSNKNSRVIMNKFISQVA